MKKTIGLSGVFRFFLTVLLFLLCGGPTGCHHNTATGEKIVLGPRIWQQWQSETGWRPCTSGNCRRSAIAIGTISRMAAVKNASFMVFGGSWCPDTQAQFPLIFGIFELASIDENRIEVYGVDRQKREPSGTAAQFRLERVPTVVVLVSGEETGRITEYPETSWEEDLAKILSRERNRIGTH